MVYIKIHILTVPASSYRVTALHLTVDDHCGNGAAEHFADDADDGSCSELGIESACGYCTLSVVVHIQGYMLLIELFE